MIVTVLSRNEAENTIFYKNDWIISITDPKQSLAILHGAREEHVLRLQFYDIDTPIKTLDGIEFLPMTEDQADAIVNFVMGNSMEKIYVHCEAGISRSAGVAGAIAKYFNEDDSYIFKTYLPNRHCYRIVLEKLMKE
jgi:predicted protein tyrosine phosphatase